MPEREPTDHFDHPERPRKDQPIGAPEPRSTLRPLLLTLAVFALLIGLYFLGAEFLVNAD
ncbi:MAG: hypothetical protein JWN84_3190 [Nocardioides sp.]|jgi:hypothetical protein|nr:hypothetical protein [Nocardioides sp.]